MSLITHEMSFASFMIWAIALQPSKRVLISMDGAWRTKLKFMTIHMKSWSISLPSNTLISWIKKLKAALPRTGASKNVRI